MSKKLNYLILTTFFLFIINLVYGNIQQPKVDSLQKVILKVEGKEKLKILAALANAHAEFDPQKTIEYGQQAIDLASALNFKEGISEGLMLVGRGHENIGSLKVAFNYFEKALTIAIEEDNQLRIGEIFNNIGTNYYYQGDYDKAMSSYHQGLTISNKINDRMLESKILHNVSSIHFQLGEYEKSLEYFQKVLAIAESLNDKEGISSVYNNMGSVYSELGKGDKAIESFQKALALAKEIGDVTTEDISTFNIGQIYLAEKDYISAKKYTLRALESSKKRNDKDVIVICLRALGDLNFQQDNHEESIRYYLEGIVIAKEMEAKPLEEEAYNGIAQNYIALKNYEKAYKYKALEYTIRDSIFTEQKSEQIHELSTKYETEKKEVENLLLKEQKIKSELIIEQKTIISWILGGLLALIGFMFYWFIRQKKLKTQLLEKEMTLLNENLKKEEVIARQIKLLQQNEQQKNKLFTNIAHEFQTPLNIIQGLTKELYKNNNLSSIDYDSLVIILKNSQHLSKTTNQILATNLDEEHHTSSNSVLFSLSDLFKYILPEFQFLAKEKSITLTSPSFDKESVAIYSDVEKIETILNNLLSNAIKYTGTKGIISVEYKMDEFGFHEISISDNGKGIQKDELSTIFDRYYQISANESESGFGLGLAICKEYISSLGGEIRVKSEQDVLTVFTIRFPKASDTILKKQITYYEFPTIAPITSLQVKNASAEPMTNLLIVEDNLDFCKFLALILEKDYHLVFVHNGQQAIKYLESNTPALIMTDWMMPGMDGLEFVQYLKTTEKYNYFPVLMLTARSLISDKLKALRIGIDDYLIKPIEADILRNRISNLLNSLEERQENIIQFPNIFTKEGDLELTLADQEWLVRVEETITPLIGDFNLNLEKIALLNQTNVKQLGLKIKKITGLTAKKYIQEIRYWEARKLLETGSYASVKAVALTVGFKDTKNFSRRFKERFGKYPSEYMLVSISKQ